MRNNTPIHAGRSFLFTLALALCACFCLPAGQAQAGPPKKSDSKRLKLSKAQCKTKVIRRDSFKATYVGTDCDHGGSGDCYPEFTLPSGKTVQLTITYDTNEKLKGILDNPLGRATTIHYEVRRQWREWLQTNYDEPGKPDEYPVKGCFQDAFLIPNGRM